MLLSLQQYYQNMKIFRHFFSLLFVVFSSTISFAQTPEPEFIGEVYWEKPDGSYVKLGKEIGAYTSGISWTSSNALFLELTGKNAKVRVSSGETIKLIIRAVDNNSDPISIVSFYRFDVKRKKRATIIAEDNSGTFRRSRTHTENQLVFSGKKYGTSSYMIVVEDVPVGEYGIVVANPNSVDEKRTIVSCFGVDK